MLYIWPDGTWHLIHPPSNWKELMEKGGGIIVKDEDTMITGGIVGKD